MTLTEPSLGFDSFLSLEHTTELRKFLCTWFGEVCSSCCLSLLPQFACNILATTYKEIFSALYFTSYDPSEFRRRCCCGLAVGAHSTPLLIPDEVALGGGAGAEANSSRRGSGVSTRSAQGPIWIVRRKKQQTHKSGHRRDATESPLEMQLSVLT